VPAAGWLALGSGQRLNEDITGLAWPEKTERNARLRECADIIHALLAGETVTHHDRVATVNAKLYSTAGMPTFCRRHYGKFDMPHNWRSLSG
jgi:alkanesulfonate monooxygenase SsuD/methylene tetrahydromethanopterin reductase-like flavin-dependent oxidoreductase (luciferase family)